MQGDVACTSIDDAPATCNATRTWRWDMHQDQIFRTSKARSGEVTG
jgi:hypothetical protein